MRNMRTVVELSPDDRRPVAKEGYSVWIEDGVWYTARQLIPSYLAATIMRGVDFHAVFGIVAVDAICSCRVRVAPLALSARVQ